MVVPLALRQTSARTVGQRNLEAVLRAAPPATPVLHPAHAPEHPRSQGNENHDTVNVRFVLPAAAFDAEGDREAKHSDLPVIRDDLSDDETTEAVDSGVDTYVPHSLVCPITLAPFVRPVVAPDGHSYEKHAIRKWMHASSVSPMTGARMPSGRLVHNHALRATLAELSARR